MGEEQAFSPGEASWVRQKIDSLTDAAADNRARITAHEATCAERYGQIVAAQAAAHTMLRWIIGIIGVLFLIEMGRASITDLIHLLPTPH